MNSSQLIDSFEGKKVLITGHTGFKGSWLTAWLNQLGANVVGVSLDIPTKPSHFEILDFNNIENFYLDIRNFEALKTLVKQKSPDFVFHLAAQSLVINSYKNPIDTWGTNLMGTVNILESLKCLDNTCCVVLITSDKCYDNLEWEWGYRENDKLGGPDPYSASKGAAELAISSYFRSFFKKNNFINIASARAGNVIGGGDWSQNRLIPDCIRAWSKQETVILRNPNSTRPWQHVLEPLSGYLSLAINLSVNKELNGKSFNFGPSEMSTKSVLDLVKKMAQYWPMVKWNLEEMINDFHESALIKLNCDLANELLKWFPKLDFESTTKMTALWYKNYYDSETSNIKEFTSKQINDYMNLNSGKN